MNMGQPKFECLVLDPLAIADEGDICNLIGYHSLGSLERPGLQRLGQYKALGILLRLLGETFKKFHLT